MRRLLAIGFVWLGCAAAWLVLGRSIELRSGESGAHLLEEVHGLWGPSRVQFPPAARGRESHPVKERSVWHEDGKPRERIDEKLVTTVEPMELSSSDLRVAIRLEHRRKGLLWFPTFEVEFHGAYRFRNPTAEAREVTFTFPLQAADVYEGFGVTGPGGPVAPSVASSEALFTDRLAAGEAREYVVAYRSRGTQSWHYGGAGQGVGGVTGQARDFRLAVETNFPDVDFPPQSLSPTTQARSGGGWRGEWRFSSILTGKPVGLVMPQRLNPGPFAERLTLFAPVALLFYFFVVSILGLAGGRQLHPMHYFLLGCAFFAFHLLFAYLIDHVAILPAFAAAAAVSLLLAATYARHFVGWRFALREMGLAQLLYLVLFSASFFWRGWTGLAITLGAVTTLFAVMQITGKLDWERAFAGRSPRA